MGNTQCRHSRLSDPVENAEHRKKWYSYEDKVNRPLKVMARRLHITCQKDNIAQGLKGKDFKILDVVNILKKEKSLMKRVKE